MRHADRNAAAACATLTIISREVDVVDPAVPRCFGGTIALRADCQRAQCRVGRSVARAGSGRLHQLILEDTRRRDGHSISIGIGDAEDADGDHFVMGSPEHRWAGCGTRANRRLIFDLTDRGAAVTADGVAIVTLFTRIELAVTTEWRSKAGTDPDNAVVDRSRVVVEACPILGEVETGISTHLGEIAPEPAAGEDRLDRHLRKDIAWEVEPGHGAVGVVRHDEFRCRRMERDAVRLRGHGHVLDKRPGPIKDRQAQQRGPIGYEKKIAGGIEEDPIDKAPCRNGREGPARGEC